MTENTATTEVKELTKEDKAKLFKALPADHFRTAVKDVNGLIAEHNEAVDKIQRAEKKDTTSLKNEIFEQSDNPAIKRLHEEYLKLIESAEKLKDQAYAKIDELKLMPGEVSEEELANLKASYSESLKNVRAKVDAFKQMEEMMPGVSLIPLVDEIKTRRGTGGGSASSSQEGVKRPRFKRIVINNVEQDENGNTVYQEVKGEKKYTLTFAAAYLKKQHKGIKWTAKELNDAYFGAFEGDEQPAKLTFVMPYTYKTEDGHETTINYEIKTEA